MVTFPGPVALHTPDGIDQLARIQVIERTVYIKPSIEFESLRIVAEDLDTGRQIPIDLVSKAGASDIAKTPMEVVVGGQLSASATNATASGASQQSDKPPTKDGEMDMVALTRYAAQSLYAPRRLVPSQPGVRSISVRGVAVAGLYRGWRIRTTPIASWRSGQLYVTAVRFDNEGSSAHDFDPNDLRGRWLAATSQHQRLMPVGSDWYSTTVYLVCDRPFDECKEQ